MGGSLDALKQAITDLIPVHCRGCVEMHNQPDVECFSREVGRFVALNVRLAHFVGHGIKQGFWWHPRPDNDQGEFQEPELFVAQIMLQKETVECVFLDGCSMGEVAQMLQQRGMKFVICWDGPVSDSVCVQFSKFFYEAMFEKFPRQWRHLFEYTCTRTRAHFAAMPMSVRRGKIVLLWTADGLHTQSCLHDLVPTTILDRSVKRKEPDTPAQSSSSSEKWVCPMCTFHNIPFIISCAMCDARNPSTNPIITSLQSAGNSTAEVEPSTPIDAPASQSVPCSSDVDEQARCAVVIGNSSYTSFSRLENPRNDALDVCTRLHELGVEVLGRMQDGSFEWQGPATGEVVPILDATAEDIEDVVEILSDRIVLDRQVNFAPCMCSRIFIIAEFAEFDR